MINRDSFIIDLDFLTACFLERFHGGTINKGHWCECLCCIGTDLHALVDNNMLAQ